MTLGGYDQSRFNPNDVSFSFDSDDSRRLTLAIQKITATNTLHGDTAPLAAVGILSLIDSTVPHIWLPVPACHAFEKAFGLVYDNATNLYVINDTIHARLQQLNPTVTLKLGNSLSSSETVSIDLPYGAFDLQASYPIYPNATNYFPLRRASNESQYTLGRTFLQEAYIIADYERMNFSVSQAVFSSDNRSHIVSIASAGSRTTEFNAPSKSQTSGGNATQLAIIISLVLVFSILMAAIALLLLRRKRNKRLEKGGTGSPAERSDNRKPLPAPTSLAEGDIYKRDPSTASTVFTELPAYSRDREYHPASSQSKPQELLGSPSAAELESPQRARRSHTLNEAFRAQHSHHQSRHSRYDT